VTTDNSKRSLRIALTGGIASGKSMVADMFADLGATVIDTDLIARELVRPGEPALGEIEARFGQEIIDEFGELDRAAMRRVIFADERSRRDLEAILHPRIGDEVRRRAHRDQGAYQIIVVPLLTNSPLLGFVDRVLVVDCAEETQIERLLARDGGTIDQARRILAAQSRRDERLAIADDIIRNNGSRKGTRRQVLKLDRRYRRLAEHATESDPS
jgi:dephospho-CoA kinase